MNDKIQKLNDYEHLRLKTEMYLGSRTKHTQEILVYDDNGTPTLKEVTWVPALCTAFREALDNAVDEVVGHGYGHRINIDYNEETHIITVEDDGRGIPIEYDSAHKDHLCSMAVSHARAGRNFGERGNVSGTNGIGIAAVNMTSKWFELDIHRDNKHFVQLFEEIPNGKNLVKKKPKITDITTNKTGTKVSFTPSEIVFSDLTLPAEFVKSRVYEVAVAHPLIRVHYNGERLKVSPNIEKTLFPNTDTVVLDIKVDGFSSKFILVPQFTGTGETIHSIVNSVPAFNGGVHMDTFRRLFYSGLLSALERESKRRKVTPNKSDIVDGLLIYNVTHMKAPDFDSQSKTRLINESVGEHIKKFFNEEDFFGQLIKKNRAWIDSIFERAAERTHKKDLIDTKKAVKSAKKSKVPGLMDASGRDRKKCILFLAEGLSAIAGLSSVRNPDIHGGLGLRGKVLNVNGEVPKRVLDNSTLVDIMNSVGLVIGETANRSNLRYGKIYIAADQDQDGANITALLINFLHTYWPELFDTKDEPFVHVFMTPFIIVEKGKERHYWHAHNHHEFDPDKWKGATITRAKGLGTLTKEDWRHSLQNIVSIPILDDGNMKESLDLVFNGARADDRKNWLGI